MLEIICFTLQFFWTCPINSTDKKEMVQHVSEFFENGFENAFKKDKEELQKRSNTASQPYNGTQTMQDQNHRNTNSYH